MRGKRSRLIHVRLVLTFLTLGSLGSFVLGHELGSPPAFATIYAHAITGPLAVAQASGALSNLPFPFRTGRAAHHTAAKHTAAKTSYKDGGQSTDPNACPPGAVKVGAPLALPAGKPSGVAVKFSCAAPTAGTAGATGGVTGGATTVEPAVDPNAPLAPVDSPPADSGNSQADGAQQAPGTPTAPGTSPAPPPVTAPPQH